MEPNNKILEKIKNKKIYRIIFYGPSTTNMQSIFPAWPEIIRYALRDHFEKTIGDWKGPDWYIQTANRSLDGATSGELLQNCQEFVLDEKPDLVILSASKNDAYFDVDPKETEANEKQLIDKLIGNNIDILFTTSMPSSDKNINNKIVSYMEVDRGIALFYKDNARFKFIDLFQLAPEQILKDIYTLNSDGNEVMGFKVGDIDTVHFNRYGNAVVAGIVLKECFGFDFDARKFLTDSQDETRMYPRF